MRYPKPVVPALTGLALLMLPMSAGHAEGTDQVFTAKDLKAACLTALALDRAACRDFARGLTWEATARTFVKHVTEATQKPRRRRDRDRAAA